DRLHWLTMPDADFCAAIGKPYGLFSLSAEADQQQRRSPEVSSTVFHAQPPNLRSASLMDMDFVVPRPLVRRSRLICGFCASAHAFARGFLQTPPTGDALALCYPFTSIRLGRGLSPPNC